MGSSVQDIQLITVFEAERLTGRKVATWRKDIRLRKIDSVKLGRSVRLPRSAVEAFVREGWRPAVKLEESAR